MRKKVHNYAYCCPLAAKLANIWFPTRWEKILASQSLNHPLVSWLFQNFTSTESNYLKRPLRHELSICGTQYYQKTTIDGSTFRSEGNFKYFQIIIRKAFSFVFYFTWILWLFLSSGSVVFLSHNWSIVSSLP